MISKRGQSEVITTVLIILLVLAAIIIVWQVVQGTLKQGQTDITNKRDCLGLEMVIVKATAARGDCNYTGPAECNETNVLITPCATKTGCTYASSSQTTPGSILIRREGTSAVKGIKTQLLIDDKINASSTEALDIIYATDTYSIDNLAVNAQVQVTPLLSDGTPCGLTEKYKVTPI